MLYTRLVIFLITSRGSTISRDQNVVVPRNRGKARDAYLGKGQDNKEIDDKISKKIIPRNFFRVIHQISSSHNSRFRSNISQPELQNENVNNLLVTVPFDSQNIGQPHLFIVETTKPKVVDLKQE